MLFTIKLSTLHGSLPIAYLSFWPWAPSVPERACIPFRLATSSSYITNHAHIYLFSHLACSAFPYLNHTISQRLAHVQSALQCSLRDLSPPSSPWTQWHTIRVTVCWPLLSMPVHCLVIRDYEPFDRKKTDIYYFVSPVKSCLYEKHNKYSIELDQLSVGLQRTF